MSCHNCKHRGTLPGDAHSKCNHPGASIGSMVCAKFGETTEGQQVVVFPGTHGLMVIGDRYGFDSDWFLWPLNFDPAWLLGCTGYEEVQS